MCTYSLHTTTRSESILPSEPRLVRDEPHTQTTLRASSVDTLCRNPPTTTWPCRLVRGTAWHAQAERCTLLLLGPLRGRSSASCAPPRHSNQAASLRPSKEFLPVFYSRHIAVTLLAGIPLRHFVCSVDESLVSWEKWPGVWVSLAGRQGGVCSCRQATPVAAQVSNRGGQAAARAQQDPNKLRRRCMPLRARPSDLHHRGQNAPSTGPSRTCTARVSARGAEKGRVSERHTPG